MSWDDRLIDGLVAAEDDFWKRYVSAKIMPPPDGSKACDEVIEQYFHNTRKQGSIALVGFDDKLRRREEILGMIAELETEQKKIEQEVKLYMKDHELASSEKYRVSWSSVDTARLDAKRIKMEQPEIYQDYVKVSSSRRFSVKVA